MTPRKRTDDEEDTLSATLGIRLRADSGYASDETHRISLSQWGRICEVLYERCEQTPPAPRVLTEDSNGQ